MVFIFMQKVASLLHDLVLVLLVCEPMFRKCEEICSSERIVCSNINVELLIDTVQ